MSRRALAMILVSLLVGIPSSGQTTPLGRVIQSANARLNSAAASVGTTIYNGDRLSAEVGGVLGARFSAVQLLLSADSALFVGQEGANLIASLQQGTVTFTVESGGIFRLTAADVQVRPQSSALTVGQMTLEECAVVVTSRLQPLEVTAGKETKIVEAGQSYRVSLNTGCGRHANRGPVPAAHSRFLVIPISVVAGITLPAIHEAFESPDRP